MIALLHGDAPFGWQGFAFAILMTVALVIVIEELTRATLTKLKRKRARQIKRAGKATLTGKS
jgi:heme exporter protein D